MAAPKSSHPREMQREPSTLYHIVALLFSFGISGYLVYAWGDSESFKQWISFTPPSRPLPPQSILIDPRLHNVLGEDGSFRNVTTAFNPFNTPSPHFQIWNPAFYDILGPNPSVRLISKRDDYAFAHEAPVYDPIERHLFFSSNNGGPLGMSNWTHNNRVFRIKLSGIDFDQPKDLDLPFEEVPVNPPVEMVNGGTPFGKNILLVGSGRAHSPPHIALVNPRPPYNSTTILDNIHGRQFNSLNDVKIHPKSGAIFFTDTVYGFINHFRPEPQLPSQVYRLDPQSGEVRVVADGFDKCNGIAFSPDGRIAYIGDSGAANVRGGYDATLPAMVYAFDVDPISQTFLNRRVLTWIDTGVPDGISTDAKGNVYVSSRDGVQVFNPQGVLLGKIFTGMFSANHVFTEPGNLIVLSETKIFLVKLAASSSLIQLK